MVNEKCKIIVQEQPRSVYDTYILPSEVFLNSQVVAMALLILNKPFEREIRIIRTQKIWTVTDYKFFTKIDIGDGEYDSLKLNFNERRPTGELYSCAGLIFRDNATDVIKHVSKDYIEDDHLLSKVAEKIDREIILPLDLEAQGVHVGLHKFSYISDFIPAWTLSDAEDFEIAFENALDVTVKILRATIQKEIENAQNESRMEELLSNHKNGILILPSYKIPWKETVIAFNESHADDQKINFVMYKLPGEYDFWSECWEAHAVPISMDKPGYRILFPEEWPELSLTERLNEIANLDEYVFCHQNRTSVRCSEEAAVKMCRIAKEIYSSKTKK